MQTIREKTLYMISVSDFQNKFSNTCLLLKIYLSFFKSHLFVNLKDNPEKVTAYGAVKNTKIDPSLPKYCLDTLSKETIAGIFFNFYCRY
jgi:hypothetical protein